MKCRIMISFDFRIQTFSRLITLETVKNGTVFANKTESYRSGEYKTKDI